MKIYCFLISCFLLLVYPRTTDGVPLAMETEVLIYGGTSAGITAAIQASRLGRSVILLEPSSRIGGLTTGGLGQTDIGNKQAIGGISREFYQNIRKYYDLPENWKWQKKQDYRDVGQTRTEEGENAMWTFEPSAALQVYLQMLKDEGIEVIYQERLNREKGVKSDGKTIQSITTESGNTYRAKIFIDATYEGDLMAAAGVSYTIGREANDEYGETLNGVQANSYHISLKGTISKNARNHNFISGVDPYIEKGNPESGLLPWVNENPPGIDGTGDDKIQAYCFRMCLTDHPENRIPFQKPETYNEMDYELLFRNYEAAEDIDLMYDYGVPYLPWANSPMPNRKTDTNNKHGFSTDFIGQNYAYPEASYAQREAITKAHRNYQKGLMWTLAYHPRIPGKVRKEVSRWGTSKDEFGRKDGWPEQLYIREARRMVSDYVMTQKNCEKIVVANDPIGLAAYGMDSHHVQRYVDANGFVQNEGNVESRVAGPFPISYKSIVPKKGETDNLLVPVCLSATHIAFGSIRMEPVFMVLGQSAAIAASLAIDHQSSVQEVPYQELKTQLIANQQRLE